jgi:hypothetical protein
MPSEESLRDHCARGYASATQPEVIVIENTQRVVKAANRRPRVPAEHRAAANRTRICQECSQIGDDRTGRDERCLRVTGQCVYRLSIERRLQHIAGINKQDQVICATAHGGIAIGSRRPTVNVKMSTVLVLRERCEPVAAAARG